MFEIPGLHDVKDIPGFKAIMRAILRNQIQHLVDQLSTYAQEESIFLMVNATEGALCQLGTESGKAFLGHNKEIRSKFLSFCLRNAINEKYESNTNFARQPTALFVNSHHKLGQTRPSPYIKSRKSSVRRWSDATNTAVTQKASETLNCDWTNSEDNIKSNEQTNQSEEFVCTVNNSVETVKILKQPEQSEICDISEMSSDAGNSENSDGQVSQLTVKQEEERAVGDKPETDTDAGTSEYADGHVTQVTVKQESFAQDYPDDSFIVKVSDLNQSTGLLNMDESGNWEVIPAHPGNETGGNYMIVKTDEKLNRPLFHCGYCMKSFKNKADCNRHIRIHTGEKPFKCDVCRRRFNDRGNMLKHMNRHIGLQQQTNQEEAENS